MTSVPAPPALEVSGLNKTFGVTRALKDAELTVASGEVMALVGGNGSGKSTVVKSLAGVVHADSGSLRINGLNHDLASFTPGDSRRCGLHMVHQHRTVFNSLSVLENLSIGRGFETNRLKYIQWPSARRRTEDLIERYDIRCRPDDRVADLRPASQTMLEIARALQDQTADDEGVLILDEPTASLPSKDVEFLLKSLRGFADAGQAVLFISHRLDEVLDLADAVTCLRDGQTVARVRRSQLDRESLIDLIAGREVEVTSSNPIVETDAEPVFSAKNISGGAVNDISFDLKPGEIVGLAGLEGSGRSTLMRLAFGAQKTTGGTFTLNGEKYAPGDSAEAIRAGIGLVPEDRAKDAVFPQLSIAENLVMGRMDSFTRAGMVDHVRIRQAGREAIGDFGVKAQSELTPIANLSGGNQQKVSVGRWLFNSRPHVLLLDEPTQGVDVGARSEIWEILRQAAAQGSAILVVSSDLEEIVHLAHRLIIIKNGRDVSSVDCAGLSPETVNRTLQSLEVGL